MNWQELSQKESSGRIRKPKADELQELFGTLLPALSPAAYKKLAAACAPVEIETLGDGVTRWNWMADPEGRQEPDPFLLVAPATVPLISKTLEAVVLDRNVLSDFLQALVGEALEQAMKRGEFAWPALEDTKK